MDGNMNRRLLSIFGLMVFSVLISISPAYSQDAEPGDTPPPPKVMSKEEKAQLEVLLDVKRRTKLALELMDVRMKAAEQFHDSQDLDAMFLQLGAFHALVDNTLEFLNKSDKDSGKVLNNFKRFEIGLRVFAPRIEVIRRDAPLKYEFYLRSLGKYIRNARAEAVESLFSDSVVPTKKQPN